MSWAIQNTAATATAATPISVASARAGLTAATSAPDLAGEPYVVFLERMHAVLQPKTYFEVGTLNGESLGLSGCASIAVDPAFQLQGGRVGNKPYCGFYQMRSDDFFAAHSPSAIFGRPIDMAFLDGLHFAEALLRDFANTERHCRPNSVILLHDVVPIDVYIADRDGASERRGRLSSHPEWWTGDVWKVLPLLRRFRPDLSVHVFDATPTGLAVVTNLDPASTVLHTNYAALLRDVRAMDLESYGLPRFIDELGLERTGDCRSEAEFATRFWL